MNLDKTKGMTPKPAFENFLNKSREQVGDVVPSGVISKAPSQKVAKDASKSSVDAVPAAAKKQKTVSAEAPAGSARASKEDAVKKTSTANKSDKDAKQSRTNKNEPEQADESNKILLRSVRLSKSLNEDVTILSRIHGISINEYYVRAIQSYVEKDKAGRAEEYKLIGKALSTLNRSK